MNHKDFAVVAYEVAAGFLGVPRCIWQDGTLTDLTASAQTHAELPRACGELAEQQAGEVSPFLYVMF